MTKVEMNSIIESVWTKHLQETDNIPEDLANKFSLWLQSVLRKAAPLLSNKPQQTEQLQAQAQAQAQAQPQQA